MSPSSIAPNMVSARANTAARSLGSGSLMARSWHGFGTGRPSDLKWRQKRSVVLRARRSDREEPMAATVFDGVDAVRAAVGQHLGYSDWLEITQERVNLFAD